MLAEGQHDFAGWLSSCLGFESAAKVPVSSLPR